MHNSFQDTWGLFGLLLPSLVWRFDDIILWSFDMSLLSFGLLPVCKMLESKFDIERRIEEGSSLAAFSEELAETTVDDVSGDSGILEWIKIGSSLWRVSFCRLLSTNFTCSKLNSRSRIGSLS